MAQGASTIALVGIFLMAHVAWAELRDCRARRFAAQSAVTVIGGKSVPRRPGESSAVPAGRSMVVQLRGRSENALLQVFTVSGPP